MNILSPVISNFPVVATSEKFIVKDNFVVNTKDSAVVKISYISKEFKDFFINKIEDLFNGSIICGRDLSKDSLGAYTFNELGGQEKAETTLTEIYAMMKNQAKGRDGDLLTNGFANIFHVRDINNILRVVDVRWLDGAWYVDASSVRYPVVWVAGLRIFSRNSSKS